MFKVGDLVTPIKQYDAPAYIDIHPGEPYKIVYNNDLRLGGYYSYNRFSLEDKYNQSGNLIQFSVKNFKFFKESENYIMKKPRELIVVNQNNDNKWFVSKADITNWISNQLRKDPTAIFNIYEYKNSAKLPVISNIDWFVQEDEKTGE